jgi:effector-binding domain-containing protein
VVPKGGVSLVRVVAVQPIAFAAASSRVSAAEVPKTIPALLNRVYDHLNARKIHNVGVNIVLYHPEESGQYVLDAGVRVDGEVGAGGGVRIAATPGGRAATVAYWGPFSGLPEVHRRVRDWCAANGDVPAGATWEVYGHWSDNADDQRTDVFWLLR